MQDIREAHNLKRKDLLCSKKDVLLFPLSKKGVGCSKERICFIERLMVDVKSFNMHFALLSAPSVNGTARVFSGGRPAWSKA
jgi:hypothetical protein